MKWRRRTFFQGVGASFLAACDGGNVEPFSGLTPWHLWGGTVQMEQAAIAAAQPVVSSQLAKIHYGRPETWAFFFGAKIIDGTPPTGAGDLLVKVDVDVMIGVGRTFFDTQQPITSIVGTPAEVSLVQFFWRIPPSTVPTLGRAKWTQVGRTPLLNDDVATSAEKVEYITAQDIQVQAKLSVLGAALGSAKVAVTALFAPLSHVRPDWFKKQFDGQELGGK